MLRKALFSACVAGGLALAIDTTALGHGGRYLGPGDVQGPPDPGTPPTTGNPPGTPPTTPPGGTGPITPGPNGPSTPGPNGPVGPNGGGKGAGPSTPNGRRSVRQEGFESWQYWWEYNKDRFLDVRARLAAGTVTSGGASFLKGRGDEGRVSDSNRPSTEMVLARIVPILRSVLREDDADIVDSAVLALGRSVPQDSAAVCLDDLKAALASRHGSVQQSAILALGVLGSRDAVPMLVDILNDSAAGRESLRVDGQVPDLQRAFAALALGYIGAPDTIPVLENAIRRNPNTERSIRATAIVALGEFEAGKEEIVPFLMELLNDDRMDDDTAGQVPIALARLGADPALPQLLKIAASRKSTPRREESAVIALGMLARPSDQEVVTNLLDKIQDGQNEQARQFAIMALADIAERAYRADDSGESRAFVATITSRLLKETMDSRRKAHEPWAGLALAIVGRAFAPDSRERLEVATRLAEKFEKEVNPSYQPAYALALGILDATAAAGPIAARMSDTKDLKVKGFCAVALGMLRHVPVRDELRRYLLDDRDPVFRLQVATALGLMGDVSACDPMIEALRGARTLSVISSLASAIGLIGDRTAIDPLAALVHDRKSTGFARGFGCVALGRLAEKSDLPWNASVSVHLNYRTQVPALREVCDIN